MYFLVPAGSNECVTASNITTSDDTQMSKIFHPLLALIASSKDRELAKYIQVLKEENKILRARVPGQIHTRPGERERLLKFGKAIGRAIEELITIVTPGTIYRWLREEDGKPKAKNPKGGQRKPREIRELVIQIAKATGFGYTEANPQCPPLRFVLRLVLCHSEKLGLPCVEKLALLPGTILEPWRVPNEEEVYRQAGRGRTQDVQ